LWKGRGYTHAQALASPRVSRFIAVYDAAPARVEAFAARYRTRTYSDLDGLLADSEVETASICLPRPTHPDLAVACAWADIHCLIEKPMAVDLQGVAQTVWVCHASQPAILLLTVDQ